MALLLTKEAFQDLNEIEVYLSDKSQAGLTSVKAAILGVFATLKQFPNCGKETNVKNIRVFIEQRYNYTIPYYLKNGDIWVLRIYSSRLIPLDYASLNLP